MTVLLVIQFHTPVHFLLVSIEYGNMHIVLWKKETGAFCIKQTDIIHSKANFDISHAILCDTVFQAFVIVPP